ncbi:hypothetical protein EJ06DRAFT_559170 [Trichodelitschia bisporula]|uniref:Uncharacterized protein n=1 Tax=Trichodelitschia bisporula TaxID=703511 RepID=A0A6G1HMG6_9PEZI|nr:hypothetical protein EJ06DRAFT_559170 [Trichodelitschia bisporula]
MFPASQQDTRERPWDENEIVHLASEILRTSSVSRSASEILFDRIRSDRIEPNWEDLVLPNGRTVRSCQNVFSQRTRTPRSAPLTASIMPAASSSETRPPKRPLPSDTYMPTGRRPIAPKSAPTFPPPPGDPRFSHTYPSQPPQSPLADPTPALGEPRKKRGRPTKKEAEERKRQQAEELRARSEFQQSSSLSYPPQQPLAQTPLEPYSVPPGTPGPTSSTPQIPPPEETSGGSNGKRRRGRPAKHPPEEAPPRFDPRRESLLQQPTGYDSPPRDRRASVSTRSETTRTPLVGGPALTAARESDEEARGMRSRTWNDTVMGERDVK